MTDRPLRIGFIPLIDAAALIVAVDKGFARRRGPRRRRWCAKCRGPMCATSSISACSTPPICWRRWRSPRASASATSRCRSWRRSGSASTAMRSPCRRRSHAAIMAQIDGDVADPMVTAQALARVRRARRHERGREPLTFGMTFPFSTHNYQLRFWMAAGGVDPDEDVRLVVLPPPYMVDSLANGHVDAFCVGAPWNSVAVDLGIGHILHFVSDILVRAAEKVLAVRQRWAEEQSRRARCVGPGACQRAAAFIEQPENRAERPRILPVRTGWASMPRSSAVPLDGRLKISPDGKRARERPLSAGGPRGRRAA